MDKIPVREIKVSDSGIGFNIRRVETLLSGEEMVQKSHRHNFFFVLVIEKGKGEHIIDFTSYPVNNHSVFFMRPGQVHQLSLKKGTSGYLMEFDPGFYAPHRKSAVQIFRKVSHKKVCQPKQKSFETIITALNSIFNEFSAKDDHYREFIRASLEIIFIELSRQNIRDDKFPSAKGVYAHDRLEELKELMERHIVSIKQVAKYADLLHMTSYQLNAITRETLGKSCSQVINDYIILEAKRQLLATTGQINQIAFQLGYEDTSYFIRFFKKHTGYSPEAFRNNFG